MQTNTAGEVYCALNGVRNAFLHGNPVTPDLLRLNLMPSADSAAARAGLSAGEGLTQTS